MSWKTKTWFCLLVLLKVFTPKSSRLGGPSLNLSILGNMDLQNDVTFQNLACQVLNKKIRNSFAKCWLTIIFLWSCLGRPRHENHNSSLGLMLKLITPKGFKTWNTSLENCNQCQDLGTWSCKNVAFQNLASQVLNKKICWMLKLGLSGLDNYFHLCSCLGKPSHERHYDIWYPKKFKTWNTKS